MSQPNKYLDYLYCNLSNSDLITWRDNQLYLGIVDGTIGAWNAESMRTKSQAFDTFQRFICQIKRQSGKKLKY